MISDEPFTREDIITLQDPKNPDKHNYTKFYHLHQAEEDAAAAAAAGAPKVTSEIKAAAPQTNSIMVGVGCSSLFATKRSNYLRCPKQKELKATESAWKKDLGLHSSLSSDAIAAPSDAAHTAHYSTGNGMVVNSV